MWVGHPTLLKNLWPTQCTERFDPAVDSAWKYGVKSIMVKIRSSGSPTLNLHPGGMDFASKPRL